MPDRLRGVLRIVAALLTTLLLTAGVIALAHGNPVSALEAMLSGAFGSRYDFGNTLAKTTPLLLTSLGVALAFRARLWNIGGEGQFLVGTVAASAVGAYRLHNLPAPILIPLLLLGGALAGVPEVISTIMLNFIAVEVVSYLVGFGGPMQEATRAQPASAMLPSNATLLSDLPNSPVHLGLAIALLAAAIVAVFLKSTRGGFALRAVGANPEAARVAGIPVERTQIMAMLCSGALCGLAGAVELSGSLGTFSTDYAPGYGFTAIAVALLGRLNPWGIVGAAFFFGALTAGSGMMERSAGVSSVLIYVIQACALLIMLGFQSRNWKQNGVS
jgi:ABC-type uncharacterized transport system permease subunit